jgi:hypothetical protein
LFRSEELAEKIELIRIQTNVVEVKHFISKEAHAALHTSGQGNMDAINSIVAVAATLAGIWTASVIQEIRIAQSDSAVAVRNGAGTRSIELFDDLRARAAGRPTLASSRPLR